MMEFDDKLFHVVADQFDRFRIKIEFLILMVPI